jgi:uncharacterized protein (DUF488 family)
MENDSALPPHVFTIGHSNHTAAHFLSLLRLNGIEVVVDARSQPYSKYASQFDHEQLKAFVQNAGLRYLYLGRELGGKPQEKEFYDREGRVLYDRIASTARFQEGLSRLERGIRECCVAVLCAEENPLACHRRLLVGRMLLDRGIHVEHIRGDGRVQTDQEVDAECDPGRNQLALFQTIAANEWKFIR